MRALWAITILLAFTMLGSNGSCANVAGPGYGSPGYGGGGGGQQGSQTFYAPSIGGNRVDWCLNWGANCGQPAATAFCQRMGYQQATAWNPAPNIGASSPTLVLGDNAICNQPHCTGFQNITCSSGGGFGQPGAGQPVSFTQEPNTDRPGMNYRNVWLSQANPKQCKNLCRKDPNCRAYTYVNPGVQGPQARCWLKSGVPAPVANNNCFSGRKR